MWWAQRMYDLDYLSWIYYRIRNVTECKQYGFNRLVVLFCNQCNYVVVSLFNYYLTSVKCERSGYISLIQVGCREEYYCYYIIKPVGVNTNMVELLLKFQPVKLLSKCRWDAATTWRVNQLAASPGLSLPVGLRNTALQAHGVISVASRLQEQVWSVIRLTCRPAMGCVLGVHPDCFVSFCEYLQ